MSGEHAIGLPVGPGLEVVEGNEEGKRRFTAPQLSPLINTHPNSPD